MKRYQNTEDFITAFPQWDKELKLLHKILKSTKLTETIKWGAPVYATKEGKNIVGMSAFKSYVGLWFFQGALLKDKSKKLMNAQEGITKAMRQWRFNSIKEIDGKLIKAYVKEAVENQNAGKEIKPVKKKTPPIPKELKALLIKNKTLSKFFNQLSAFKQREYIEYIIQAKREETKQKRLEKIIPLIKSGIGLNDKFR